MSNYIVHGKPYWEWLDEIKEWDRVREYKKAEELLLEIIDHIEKYDSKDGVAPAYYERLAIIYSKQKRKDDEIEILKRFSRQKHSPGVKPGKLMERLDKLLK